MTARNGRHPPVTFLRLYIGGGKLSISEPKVRLGGSCSDVETYQQLLRLGRAFRLTSEEEVAMDKRGPKLEDKFVAYPRWPEEIMKEFGIGGSTYQVHIL